MKTRLSQLCCVCQGKAIKRRKVGRVILYFCAACIPVGKNKFGARKVQIGDEVFDSAKEAQHWQVLRCREQAGEIKNLKRQVRFDLHGKNGVRITWVKVDFTYEEDGKPIVCEVKGYFKKDAAYTIRKKLFKNEYPEVTHVEV